MTFQNNQYSRPFWVFCYDVTFIPPRGGLDDVLKTFNTYEEAKEFVQNLTQHYDRVEIFHVLEGIRETI